jgi:hypothetical protein
VLEETIVLEEGMNTLDGSLELDDRVVLGGTIGLEEASVLNNVVVPGVVNELEEKKMLEDASVLEGAMELADMIILEGVIIPDDIALLGVTTTLDRMPELKGAYCEDEDCADDVCDGGVDNKVELGRMIGEAELVDVRRLDNIVDDKRLDELDERVDKAVDDVQIGDRDDKEAPRAAREDDETTLQSP